MFLRDRIRHAHNRWPQASAAVLLTFCGAVFIMRGPVRAASSAGLNDLISPYVQATALVHGADPYSPRSLLKFWPKDALASRPDVGEFSDGSILILHGVPTAYPLTTFLILAPATVLPWHIFKFLAIVITVVLFFLAVWSLINMAEINRSQKLLFIAVALLFAPMHTGIATSNLAIVATELGVISLRAHYSGRQIRSGLLIAVCTALKPQIGVCFLIYHTVRRHARVSAFALGGFATLSAICTARLAFAHVDWLSSYWSDNRALFTTGVLGDFTERNPMRFGLVNLQVPLYALLHSRQTANLLALAFSAVLFAVWLILALRVKKQDDLLCLGTLACVGLLPIYHRFYDASLLLIPLYCLLVRSKSGLRRNCVIGFLALAAFMLPGGSILETLRNEGLINSILGGTGLWNGLVMAHAGWCLLVLALVLLYEMSTLTGDDRELHQERAPYSFSNPEMQPSVVMTLAK